MYASKVKTYATALTLSLLLLPAASWAEERHHEAHVHGLAHLDIAIDGKQVDIELESPAANIIGFEHSPKNEEELHHAQKAMSQMKDGEALFLFTPAAECRQLKAKVETGMELALHHDEDDHDHDEDLHDHDHDKDLHDHDHDEDLHDHDHDEDLHDHDHDGDSHDHGHESHADIDGEYTFICEKPEKLNSLKVNFFETFRGFEKIKLQLLSRDKQTGADLTSENNSIAF